MAIELNQLFETFRVTPHETEADQKLHEMMIDYVTPLISGIVEYKLRRAKGAVARMEAEDVIGNVLLQVLSTLRQCRKAPRDLPILNLRNYLATVAYNACNLHFRRKFPNRQALKSKLRYILAHHQRFALWKINGKFVCGYAGWKGKITLTQSDLNKQELSSFDLIAQLHLVFSYVEAPLEFEGLVNYLMDTMNQERQPREVPESSGLLHVLPARSAETEKHLINLQYLQRIWRLIRELPYKQRVALLLHLRDDQGEVLTLFSANIANAREIAETIKISAEEFEDIWNKLPFDDLRIGQILGATRQQVINLRKSARERLSRRLAGSTSGIRRLSNQHPGGHGFPKIF